jgi:hypothetical protein
MEGGSISARKSSQGLCTVSRDHLRRCIAALEGHPQWGWTTGVEAWEGQEAIERRLTFVDCVPELAAVGQSGNHDLYNKAWVSFDTGSFDTGIVSYLLLMYMSRVPQQPAPTRKYT